MLPTAYIETTVVSYLTGRPSGSVISAAKQVATAEWWAVASSRFRLVSSIIVVAEARRGESEMSRRRLEVLNGLSILHLTDAVAPLAERLVAKGLIPAKALQDAFHISLAACYDVDLLVTWNFKHIANPSTRAGIASFLTSEGYRPPLLCSPLELMESAYEH